MAQTKEEQQEKARQRKEDEDWAERNAEIIRGRPLRPGEGKAARSEWDTAFFDPKASGNAVYCHYNYRLRRDEWSAMKIPAEFRDDYDSDLWPKLPDGRSACMFPDKAAELGIPLVKIGTIVELDSRRARVAENLQTINPENVKQIPRRIVLPSLS